MIGREVCYEHQTYAAYKEAAIARGLTDALAQEYVDVLRAKVKGMDNMASHATWIIGGTGFRQWIEQDVQPALA